MKDPTFVSMVLRLTNSDRDVQTIRILDEYLSSRFGAYEFILVNDTSTDFPDSVNTAISESQGSVVILELAYHQGLEPAMLAGVERAMGDFVFEIDDGVMDYPVEILDTLYATARAGNDIVAATPEKTPLMTRLLYWFANRSTKLQPALRYERLRLSSRRAVDAMLRQTERIRYREILYRYTGYKHAHVPYRSTNRAIVSPPRGLAFGVGILWSFNEGVGTRIARIMGAFFFLASAAALIGVLTNDKADPLEVLVAVFDLIGFAGVFVLFALVIEFQFLILGEVRDRPSYTLDRTLTRTILRPSPVLEADVHDQQIALRERERAVEFAERSRARTFEPDSPDHSSA